MAITVTQNVTKYNITVTQSGNSISLQPIICKDGDSWDGIVNGGTP